MTVKVEGAARLAATLRRAGADLSDLKEVNRRAAQYVMPLAVAMSPVKYGELKATHRTSATASAGVVKAGSRKVPYAQVVHWGNPKRNSKPNRYLTRAAQRSEPTWIKVYEREMREAINKVKGI